MRASFRYWVPLGLFFVISVVLWQGLRHDPHHIKSPLVGHPMPSTEMVDMMHPTHHWSAKDWQGKVVVLNVFASWCVSCQIEHPELMELAQSQTGVTWVGLDYMDTVSSAKAFLKKSGQPYRWVLSDPNGKLAIDLGVYGVPETFIIDKQGIIRYKHSGPITRQVWNDEMLPIINKYKQMT